jgi:hypothetical protein
MNPLESREPNFEELLDRLEDRSSLSSNFFGLLDLNHHVYRFLRGFTITGRYSRMVESEQEKREAALKAPFAIMIACLARLFNKDLYVFPIVALSLLALKCRVSAPFWAVLLKLRVLYDQRFAIRVATALGLRARDVWPRGSSRKVAISVGDNCMYKIRTNFEHALDEFTQCNYETINWMLVPVSGLWDTSINARECLEVASCSADN